MLNLLLARIFVKVLAITMKKFAVLGVLFILPITIYIFFASGKDNFARLPVLTESISELSGFKTLEGASLEFKDHITVLGFFGNNIEATKGNAFNLAHKIYKKNHGFQDFQLVLLLPEGTQNQAIELKSKLNEIADTKNWKFAFGSSEAIEKVFTSLKSNYILNDNYATPYVFIIDKDGSLRGRDDDEDQGTLYGFKSSDVAEINNKMNDDIKVVLAEYRLALKKYKANREI